MPSNFSEQECQAIYRVIRERRDVRSDFLSRPVPDEVLGRILKAAHQAPSVGYMQPWDFVLIENVETRKRIQAHVQEMKDRANIYDAERGRLYDSLKLEGILQAPVNICITCDSSRSKGYGLGRQSAPMTDLYSTVCAIQNFWLAARAESVGVGWVSILDLNTLRQILGIPPHIQVVAYLCAGYVSQFRNRPELEMAGWESRTKLSDLLHFECWNSRDTARSAAICDSVTEAL